MDSCFSFKVAVVGRQGVGKTSLANMWRAVPSFDRLLNGVPPPLLRFDFKPTEFVDYIPIDVVVRRCKEAAAHRVYLLDTPGAPDRHVLRRGLIEKTSMEGGVDGVIVLVDSSDTSTAEGIAATAKLVDDCVSKSECLVLLIHRGSAIPSELSAVLSTSVQTVATADLLAGIVEETHALINLVEALHARAVWRRDEAHLAAEELQRHINHANSRRHARSLPSRKVDYIALPARHQNPTREVRVALYGGACTGKSAFMASLLDGFSLHDYEPTARLEIGTLALNFPPGEVVNITLLDGPTVETEPTIAIGLVFVDLSSSFALEMAAECIDALGQSVPPMFVVLGTKSDIGPIVSLDEVAAFAAELGAPFEQIDPRKSNEQLFARIIMAMLDDDAAVVRKLHREQVLYQATITQKHIEIPHTEKEIRALFDLYDESGNGLIDVTIARKLYNQFDYAGFGDFTAALTKIRTTCKVFRDESKLTFDQFSILMCEIAKL